VDTAVSPEETEKHILYIFTQQTTIIFSSFSICYKQHSEWSLDDRQFSPVHHLPLSSLLHSEWMNLTKGRHYLISIIQDDKICTSG
jgi:hypothetical protein